jgi:hypothetical protein
MLLVRQSIDCWNAAECRKILDILLGKSADHSPMEHSPHNASGVANGLPTAKLNIRCGEKQRIAAEFANSHLERDACPRGRFGKHESPALLAKRMLLVGTACGFHYGCLHEDVLDILKAERLDGEKMFHGRTRNSFQFLDSRV